MLLNGFMLGAVLSSNRLCNNLFDGIRHFPCGFVFISSVTVLQYLSVTVCSVNGVVPDFAADRGRMVADGSFTVDGKLHWLGKCKKP